MEVNLVVESPPERLEVPLGPGEPSCGLEIRYRILSEPSQGLVHPADSRLDHEHDLTSFPQSSLPVGAILVDGTGVLHDLESIGFTRTSRVQLQLLRVYDATVAACVAFRSVGQWPSCGQPCDRRGEVVTDV